MQTWRQTILTHMIRQEAEINVLKARVDALEKRCAECGGCDGACQK